MSTNKQSLTEEAMDGFQKACVDRYGDKVRVSKILHIDENVRIKLGDEWADAVLEYPAQVWLNESKCPECNAELSGLFARVDWTLVHGVCYCTSCKKVEFVYYHYPLKGGERLCAYSLHAIPRKEQE